MSETSMDVSPSHEQEDANYGILPLCPELVTSVLMIRISVLTFNENKNDHYHIFKSYTFPTSL